MADERMKWLNEDVAEHLLRGEPLDAVDDDAHASAGRLETALAAARTAHQPVLQELPGEEAALAAFRQATAATAGSGAALGAKSGSVRVAGGRPSRWGRPVRFGLAATLAACTLGGVAVAAGAGVIPTPFGGRAEPGPAASVSAVATPPEPLSSPSGDPSEPGIAGSEEPEDEDEKKDKDRGTGGGHPSEGGSQDASSDPDGREPSSGDGSSGEHRRGNWYEQAVDACRDYRDGKPLDDAIQRKLEKAAKSPADIKRFCDKLLGSDDGSTADPGDGDHGGGDDEDGDESGSPADPSPSGTPDPAPSTAGVAPELVDSATPSAS